LRDDILGLRVEGLELRYSVKGLGIGFRVDGLE